jgi:hypothetical protein
MRVGFFTMFQRDPRPFMHAAALVREIRRTMPGVEVHQFTDLTTPEVPDVSTTTRFKVGGVIEGRMRAYASLTGEWLLLDTDVSVRQDVRDIFADRCFDVALADRNWPHLAQGERLLQEMPFNTGVVFLRSDRFWSLVAAVWEEYPADKRDWYSEQRAVYEVVRTGQFRVKILPGMIYNYPPVADEAPPPAALIHYKGERKEALTRHATAVLATP